MYWGEGALRRRAEEGSSLWRISHWKSMVTRDEISHWKSICMSDGQANRKTIYHDNKQMKDAGYDKLLR